LPAGKIGAKGREPGSPEPASGSGVVAIPKGQTRQWRVCAPGKRIRRGPTRQRSSAAPPWATGPSSRREHAAPRCYSEAAHKRDARRSRPGAATAGPGSRAGARAYQNEAGLSSGELP